MDFWIANLIYFGSSFLIMFLIYFFYFNRKKIKTGNYKQVMEVNYLVNRFNLNMRKLKYKNLLWIVNITNSFIVAVTFTIVANLDSFIWSLLVGFVILMILVYSLYEIVGRILKKRCDKNV